MATATGRYTEERVGVGQTQLYLLKGGSGRPVLALHDVEGHEGWLEFHEALAERATVYAPCHPGYGQTPAPEWIGAIPHQAVFYNWFLQEGGLGPADVVGVGIGGWIAAQMAIMCPEAVRRLVLVDAFGVRPAEGEIADIFVVPWKQVIEAGFRDPKVSTEYQRLYGEGIPEFGGTREEGRTMSMRMCYRPYMYDPSLPGMLGKVRAPTLVVWGAQDSIVPVECGRLYQQAIPGARLRVIEECGHWPHLDRPRELAAIVGEFLG